jgi:hypothetical protein
MSNVTSCYMEERENNLAMMRFVLELASDLGIDMVKVLPRGLASSTTRKMWRWMRSTLEFH